MAKEEKVAKAAKKEDLDLDIVSIHDAGFVTEEQAESMVAQLDKFDDEVEITSEYLVPEESVPYRAYKLGIVEISAKDDPTKKVNAVRFLMEDGTYKICASSVLVGVLESVPDKTPVKFMKTGENQNAKKQSYDVFSIKILGMSK